MFGDGRQLELPAEANKIGMSAEPSIVPRKNEREYLIEPKGTTWLNRVKIKTQQELRIQV